MIYRDVLKLVYSLVLNIHGQIQIEF